jgi:hypothetical protein
MRSILLIRLILKILIKFKLLKVKHKKDIEVVKSMKKILHLNPQNHPHKEVRYHLKRRSKVLKNQTL